MQARQQRQLLMVDLLGLGAESLAFFEVLPHQLDEEIRVVLLYFAGAAAAELLGPVAEVDAWRTVGVVALALAGRREEPDHVWFSGEHVAVGDVAAGGQVAGPGGDVPGPHAGPWGLDPEVAVEILVVQNDEDVLPGLGEKVGVRMGVRVLGLDGVRCGHGGALPVCGSGL